MTNTTSTSTSTTSGLQSLQTALDYANGKSPNVDDITAQMRKYLGGLSYDQSIPGRSRIEDLRPKFNDSLGFLRAAGAQAGANASTAYRNRNATLGLSGAAGGVVEAQARLPYERQAMGAEMEFDQASAAALIKERQAAYENRRKLDDLRLNYARTIADYNDRSAGRQQSDYQFQTKFNQSVRPQQQQEQLADLQLLQAGRTERNAAAMEAAQYQQPYRPGYITNSGPMQFTDDPKYSGTPTVIGGAYMPASMPKAKPGTNFSYSL